MNLNDAVLIFFLLFFILSCGNPSDSESKFEPPILPNWGQNGIMQSVEAGYLDSDNNFFPSWSVIHRSINLLDIINGTYDWQGGVVTLRITADKEKLRNCLAAESDPFYAFTAHIGFIDEAGKFLTRGGSAVLHLKEETETEYIFISQLITDEERFYTRIYFADETYEEISVFAPYLPVIQPDTPASPVISIIPASLTGRMVVRLGTLRSSISDFLPEDGDRRVFYYHQCDATEITLDVRRINLRGN